MLLTGQWGLAVLLSSYRKWCVLLQCCRRKTKMCIIYLIISLLSLPVWHYFKWSPVSRHRILHIWSAVNRDCLIMSSCLLFSDKVCLLRISIRKGKKEPLPPPPLLRIADIISALSIWQTRKRTRSVQWSIDRSATLDRYLGIIMSLVLLPANRWTQSYINL